MISRRLQEGVSCSVVELPDARHVYAAALPRRGGDAAEQTRDALGALNDVMAEHAAVGSVVRQAVFVADPGEMDTCRRLVEAFYGDAMPATTYVAQPPCPAGVVAIEAEAVVLGGRPARIERISRDVVVARHGGVAWCHCGEVAMAACDGSLHGEAMAAFGQMARRLQQAGFEYSQVVRTWLYLGDIVGGDAAVRYEELNRARADFYAGVAFGPGRSNGAVGGGRFYPASTGIGASGDGVTMSCVALASRPGDVRVVALENPRQTPAFAYDGRYGIRSPAFSRAVAVVADGAATLFISGTASITESESRHAGDVARQTHETLDNIAALVGRANLARHGLDAMGATLGDLAQLRVYLKRPGDYETVRATCCERVGDAPAIYAVADICRPELLVEIEAVGFATATA